MHRSHIVVGLGFGDEGKGSITDFLTGDTGAGIVCRFSGGAQSAHNVVTDDGRHHKFSQFGAGTFHPGVKTYLADSMLIDPISFEPEFQDLVTQGVTDAGERLYINPDCLVVTPVHKFINRVRETVRGTGRHGSCGMGIGAAREMEISGKSVLRVSDLCDERAVMAHVAQGAYIASQEFESQHNEATEQHWDLLDPRWTAHFVEGCWSLWLAIKDRVVGFDWLQDQMKTQDVVWEGSQGTLLCETNGFAPHNTWTNTTAKKADQLIGLTEHERVRVGVIRSYGTRHGAGPFPTECNALQEFVSEPHNKTYEWAEAFRVGYLDLTLLAYALRANCWQSSDFVAVTHMDTWESLPPEHRLIGEDIYETPEQVRNLMRKAERRHTYPTDDPVELIEYEMSTKVKLVSAGPRTSDKTWLK